MALPVLQTPTYELKLPSTNKTITFRPFLVKEHKILLTLSDSDSHEVSRVIKELVDVCTFNTLKVNDLPYFDIEYIFLKLRSKSIGENVDVVVTCGCGNKIETTFSIENVVVEKTPDHTNQILLTDDIGIEFFYPKIEDVLNIFTNNNQDEIFSVIIENIKGIYDATNYWDAKDYNKEDLTNFLNCLTKEQFERIEKFFTTSPKIVQIIETDCNQCGAHNVSRLEGLQNFFV